MDKIVALGAAGTLGAAAAPEPEQSPSSDPDRNLGDFILPDWKIPPADKD